jgi:hypothetical protein
MKKMYLLITMATFLWSCQKDNETPTQVSYLPLKIGNYWIYQYVQIDTSGIETILPKTDSIVISRDTIINHKKYYVLEGTNYPFTYSGYWGVVDILRDSSGYVVNQNGFIRFAVNDFSETLAYRAVVQDNDTLYIASSQMVPVSEAVTVPAGIFNVLNYKTKIVATMDTPGVKYPRYLNCYYAKGVGNILYTYFYFASPKIYEKRLVRYNIRKP